MSAPLKTSMPEDMDLPDGYVLVWAAINPTTGNDVAGVKVSGVSIFGTNLGSGTDTTSDQPTGPYMLVPGPNA